MSRDAGSDSIGTPNGPLPTEDARSLAGVPDGFGRFWTPYRMAYIRGEARRRLGRGVPVLHGAR